MSVPEEEKAIAWTLLQRAGDHWKGTKWILYKKDECEALTTRLTEFMDQLEKIVTSEEKLEELGREECDGMGDSLKTLLEIAGPVDPLLVLCATQKVEGEKVARGVSVSAGVNNGVQMGVNYGAFKGISFGTGNNITNQWGRD
jgi:single-stranded DNA-specific DHH superfamily exonuclease